MRLNVYIAKCGISSRRTADKLIAGGEVCVNGQVVREPYFNVCDNDEVTVGKGPLQLKKDTYLAFHKPKGVTTTKKDKFAEKTILDYLPKNLHNLFPVGRLDRDSSGLLILTNDGHLCHCLTHPKFSVEKEYILQLKGNMPLSNVALAKKGVQETGDILRVKSLTVFKKDAGSTFCRAVVCEGKKRHLRRLFKVLGFKVIELTRVRVGNVKLKNIKPGFYDTINKKFIYKNILFELKKDKIMVV